MKNIVLVGFMATGKTSVACELAKELKTKFIEIDELIEKREGKTIDEIFKEKGEAYFREVEKKITEEVANKLYVPYATISTGGGIVTNEENIKNLKKNGILICLEAEPEVIFDRAKKETHRPLLKVKKPLERIKELLKKRKPLYSKANYTINTSNLTISEVVNKIKKIIQKGKNE